MSWLPLEARFSGTGALALVGSGEYLPGVLELDAWLMKRLAEPARVVTLATAAGTEGPARIRYWEDLGVRHFQSLGVESVEAVPIIDRSSAMDERLAERICRANFVYLSGGKPHYLLQVLAGSLAWAAVCAVLEKGGVVAGCSAGAMIFGEQVPSSPFPGKWEAGFGFLPGTFIIPHFDEVPKTLLAGLKLLNHKLRLVGVEGDTALVCTPQGCLVRGRGRVSLQNGNSFLHFQQE